MSLIEGKEYQEQAVNGTDICGPDEYIDADGLRVCAICHKPRQIRRTVLGREIIPSVPCRCQEEERSRKEAERLKREFQQDISRMKADGLQYESLYDCCFSNDNHKNPQMQYAYKYVEHWQEMKKKGIGLLLWGPVGSGKTFMAGCIANALLEKRIPVLMTNFARILNYLTGMFNEERNQFINSLNRYSLLVLDDLGIERNTEFAMEQIFNVIDSRIQCKKPMVVCTNLELEELKNPPDLEHKRYYERIREHCVPVKVNAYGFREENIKETVRTATRVLH